MDPFTSVCGTRVKPQALVALPWPTETATRVTGFVTRRMAVRDTTITQMGLTMKASGVMTGRMAGASRAGPMAVNTVDSISRARNMARGPSDGQMAPPMREHGSSTRCTAWVCSVGRMAANIMESTLMTKSMARGR